MVRKSLVFLAVGMVIFFFASVSSADVPDSINYQGKLTTASGGCLNDTVQMTFTIYADAFGTVWEWDETQTEVEVKEGIFNVLLGSVNPLPASIFDGSAKYLGVQVESDPEMSPLKPMVTTAYAFGSHHAQEADTADYARNVPAAGIVSVDGVSNAGGNVDFVPGSNMTITPNDGANTVTFSSTAGGIGGSGTTNYIPKFTASTTVGNSAIYQSGTGDVGIGITGPAYKLHVNGDFYANTVNTGQGDYEHYAMNQHVRTSDNVAFGDVSANVVNTGYGNNELFAMNQNVRTWDAVTFATLNTGQGPNELYDMNQNVQTTDNPTFNRVYLNDYGTALGGFHVGGSSDPGTDHLIVDGNAGIGATPADKLDVNGDIRVRGADIKDAGGTSRITLTDNGLLQLKEDGGAASLTVATDGDIGIGDTSPDAQLDIESTDNYVVRSEHTGTATVDARAVYGKSTPQDYYGIGGYFEGGYQGVSALVSATGASTYYGVNAYTTTSGAGGTKYGVYGSATGLGSNYGVRGYASGGTTNYGVYYSGGLGGSGTKSCVVKTSRGPTLLYCQESPENWFEDFGEGTLANGQAHIELDALFLETVTINAANPMKVFVQLEGDCNGVYVSKGITGFDVTELKGGASNVPFSYRVVAKREGFEDRRLDYTAAGENDPYLYPEAAARMEKERLEKTGE
jgi:hypothetical protein